MKSIITISLLFLSCVAWSQRYDIVSQQICWNTGSVDSSLNRIFLVSTRSSQIKQLGYLNSNGQTVDVSGGGTFSQGYCGCCGGGAGSSGGDGQGLVNAKNGLSLESDSVILGGILKMNTSIAGMDTYGFDLTNLSYLTLSGSDSLRLITPDLLTAVADIGGVLQLNSATGRVQYTPYAFPLVIGTNGQYMEWDAVGDSLKWTSPFITAVATDSSYRFSINGSSVSEVLFQNIYTYDDTLTSNRTAYLDGKRLVFYDTGNGYFQLINNRDIGLFSIKKAGALDSIVVKYDYDQGNDYSFALEGPGGLRVIFSAVDNQLAIGQGFTSILIDGNALPIDTNSVPTLVTFDPVTEQMHKIRFDSIVAENMASGTPIAQVHVDSFAAISFDGQNDDAAFQAAWDTLRIRGYKTMGLAHGGEYNINNIEFDQITTSDTSMIIIYGNGATIIFDSQTAEPGNIEMLGVANVVWKDVVFKGKQLASNPYNINNSFLYLSNTANITLDNVLVVRPYSHGVRVENTVPSTGTEKQGVNFLRFTGTDHVDNITEYNAGYSYIYLGPGAEYNQYGHIDFYDGQSGVRGHGAANELYSNVVAEEMEVPAAFFDIDSIYQTGILYYEISNPSSNSGKIQLGELKFNHNNRVASVVVKQEVDNYPPRTVKFTNCSFLVNGGDTDVGEQVYLENCDDTIIESCTFRPRQKPGSATIILNNCKDAVFSNSQIYQTSGGIDAFELINNSNVILSNPKLVVNNIVKAGSEGSVMYSSAQGAPTYSDIFAVQVDDYLSEGSFYRLEGETSMQVKDSTAITTSFKNPVLVIDDSTYIEGWPLTSAEELVQIDQNEENYKDKWKATKGFENTIRFTMDSVLTGVNQLWAGAGLNSIMVRLRQSTTAVEVTYNTSAGTGTLSATASSGWTKDTWYTVRTTFEEDDSVKVYINGVLELADLVPGGFDISQNTNGFRIAPAINSLVGFNGKIDFFEWKSDGMLSPQRLQFGNYDPPVPYTTNGTKTGNDYRADRLSLPDFDFTLNNGVMEGTFNGSNLTDYNSISSTTDASGDLTINHGLQTASIVVNVTSTGTTFYHVQIHSKTVNDFKIRFFDATGAAVISTAVTVDWIARK